MAVVSLPSTITYAAGALLRDGTAGVAIAAGEVVYLNASTGLLGLADADASAAAAAAIGIAVNSAAVGQPVKVLYEGTITNTGAIIKQGQTYVLANVAGDIAEAVSDLTEDTSYVTSLGIGQTTTSIKIKINVGGVVLNVA